MFRKTFFVLFSFMAAFGLACQSAEQTNNSRANATNVRANMQPGNLSGSINTTTNSFVNTNVPKGATPTPGIPDLTVKTPTPKNTPPIPGIPSEEKLKKQMNPPIANRSIRESKPPEMESNSSNNATDRPRTVNKP